MINRNLSKINSKLYLQKTKIEDKANNGISNVQSVAYQENTRQDKQIVNICPHFANDKQKQIAKMKALHRICAKHNWQPYI